MRIGIVCPYTWNIPGGVQAHVRDLAEALIEFGHEVSVIAAADDDAELPPYVVGAGRAVPVPYNGSVARLSLGFVTAARVRRWIKDGNFDVLHVHEPAAPSLGLLACWAADGPIVGTFHASFGRSRMLIAWAPILQSALEKISARIAVSEAARKSLVEHLGGDAILIPNGVTTERYAKADPLPGWPGRTSNPPAMVPDDSGPPAPPPPSTPDPDFARGGSAPGSARGGSAPGSARGGSVSGPASGVTSDAMPDSDGSGTRTPRNESLGFLGRMDEPRKGLPTLLRAFELLAPVRPGLRLLLAGPGDAEEVHEKVSPALRDRVVILGMVSEEDKIRAYHSVDIFVAPNLGGESFGIVLAEAMSAGAPILASDIEAFRRVLQNGRAGVLFPVGDAGALATAATELLDDGPRRRRLSEEARSAVRVYDWSTVARDVERVYETVLGAGVSVTE